MAIAGKVIKTVEGVYGVIAVEDAKLLFKSTMIVFKQSDGGKFLEDSFRLNSFYSIIGKEIVESGYKQLT